MAIAGVVYDALVGGEGVLPTAALGELWSRVDIDSLNHAQSAVSVICRRPVETGCLAASEAAALPRSLSPAWSSLARPPPSAAEPSGLHWSKRNEASGPRSGRLERDDDEFASIRRPDWRGSGVTRTLRGRDGEGAPSSSAPLRMT